MCLIINEINKMENCKIILSNTIDLKSIGINEYAWKSKYALQIINFLTSNHYIILGGDVYEEKNNLIDFTYDSWYYDGDDDIEKSRKIAYNYITNYILENGNNSYFSIVFKKCW